MLQAVSDTSGSALQDSIRDGGGSAPAPIGWRDVALLSAVIAVALALRLAYLSQLRSSPLFAQPIMDELYHDQWARAIVEGRSFVEGPYFRAPLYPCFLAAVYAVFGHGYLVPRILQCLIGSASCGLVFLIGRQAFGRTVGAVAGFAAASYWLLIYFDNELLLPVLEVFFDLLLIGQLLRASRKPRPRTYLLAGLFLGLSAIVRPNVLLFMPAVVVWVAVSSRGEWKNRLSYAACFASGCALPILPVTSRNYLRGGDWVLISSQGGVNFYIGNNPRSDGMTAIVPDTPGDWWGGYDAAVRRAEQACGRPLKGSEVSGYYYAEGWRFLLEEPRAFLALTARKLWLFWSRWEIPNNKDLYFWTERFTPIVGFLPLSFGVVAPLGVLGLALGTPNAEHRVWGPLSLRRGRGLFALWGFVCVYMISVVAFFCTARFRVPVIAPLLILAVQAFVWCLRSLRREQCGPLVNAACVVVPAALAVHFAPGPDRKSGQAISHRSLADAYLKQGRRELAVRHYENALALDPAYITVHYDLGTLLMEDGRLEDALRHFRSAVAGTPRLSRAETPAVIASAHNNLGVTLRRLGRTPEAVVHFRAAVHLDAAVADRNARVNLAAALAELGQADEAIAAYRQALGITPDRPQAQYQLAWLLEQAGRLEEAVDHYRAAARLMPDAPAAVCRLGYALVQLQRWPDAVEPLSRCTELQPADPRAWEALSDAFARQGQYASAIEVLGRALWLEDQALVNNLAWLLATCPEQAARDGDEAVRLARSLCRDDSDPLRGSSLCPPAWLDTLAAALAEAGRFQEAQETARQALDRAMEVDPGRAEPIAARLRLYEEHQPYREPPSEAP